MLAKKMFGNNIDPACEYCEHGKSTVDGQMILCEKNGLVAPFYYCRKYIYSPLKRIPKSPPPLPQYKKEDFSLV